MSVSEPGKIITPWAESGLKNTIPPAANPATGRAGFDQGFSAINMTAKEAGGIPPFGQDFNGIFYEVTNILRYMQAGGQPTFDAALATAIGGYPKGAMVLGSDGVTLWQSKVDSNSTDPNTDPADWGTFDIGLKGDLAAPSGSDIVGFQQAGSGSVPRTSQDKIREVVSVADFGAVGDGVSDDGAAIRAAIARIKLLGGGVLFFPSGTYLVGGGNPLNSFYALSVDFNNFSIVGDSLWTTTIKVKDGSNVGPIHLSAVTYFTISNITLDGNYPNNSQPGVHGLGAVDADYVNIENVRVMRSYGYGIGFQGTTETDFKLIKINGLYLENIGGDGTDFKNKAYSNKGLIISNVYVNGVGMTELGTKKAGLDIRGPATISNVHVFANGNPVIGVRFRADELTAGGNGVGGKNSSLTNFYCDLGGVGTSDGVVIDAENVSVSDGVVLGVPSGGTGVYVTSNGKNYRVNNISATAAAGSTMFELAGDDGLIANCHAFSFAGGGIGYRLNGNRPSIISCKNFNGQYGFRRNAGTVPGTLTNCESTGATTSDYNTSLQEVPLNCNFQTSDFKSSFISAGGNRVAEFSYVDSSVNYPRFDPSIAGNPVIIRSTGADTNVDLSLIPRGAGNVRFGSHTTTADAPITGFITIKDAGGTPRKIGVIS